jgi:hypothetical protein
MNKVYISKEKNGQWQVDELQDYYFFKSTNFETNEEIIHILSWTRNFSLEHLDFEVVRVYDVEIDEKKYYFVVKSNKDDTWDVISKDPLELEKLLKDKNLLFIGEVKIV